jgi:hypothetical protein
MVKRPGANGANDGHRSPIADLPYGHSGKSIEARSFSDGGIVYVIRR